MSVAVELTIYSSQVMCITGPQIAQVLLPLRCSYLGMHTAVIEPGHMCIPAFITCSYEWAIELYFFTLLI